MSKDGGGNNLLGSDVKLAEFYLGADLRISRRGDIEITSEEMNIAQAILHRLRTAKGELADLGHPEYGSNILDFIGQPNNWTTRERLKLAIRDTIRQERRVKDIVNISVNPRLSAVSSTADKDKQEKGRTSIPVGPGVAEVETLIDEEETRESPSQSVFPGSSDLLNSVDIDVLIIPIGATQPLQIAFPFNLEAS